MADKDVAAVIRPLLPAAGALYLTRPQYHRAADPEVLAAAASGFPGEKLLCPDIPAALAAARRAAGPDDLIVVTGSLFTVGEALACLEGRSPD
jgi:dihydrofolate synthase/folylpolyglutamate synthase